ncbi:MAG: anti-sigma factor family protein [Candidatus Aminicenantales bacterium]
MKCLRPAKIYLYLEDELSSSEREKVESHLARCEKCKNAVEERRFFLQAVAGLSRMEVPQDFTTRVMERIFHPEIPFRSWLAAFALSLSALLVSSFLYIITSARGVSSILSLFLPAALRSGKGLSLLVKLYKFLSACLSVIWTLLKQVWQVFQTLTALLSPELQALLMIITLISITAFVYGLRRIFAFGENK